MTWDLEIENIGGIRAGSATIGPGVNAVRASNWQGKSSLIKAIETVMGTAATLTDGAEQGRVELTTDADTVVVELSREDGDIVRRGDPYLSEEHDRVRAEQFAFLDADNPVRRAVRTGGDLEAVLTRPLDFERLDERIAELRAEREQVEAEHERAVEAAGRLPAAQERVVELEEELEDLRARRDELTSEDGPDPSGGREALSEARAERDRLENRRSQLEDTIDNIRDRLTARREELDGLTVPDAGDLETDIADTRDQLAEVEQEIDLLESLYEANKRVLDAGRLDLITDVEHGLVDDALSCWVCGGDADRAAIESQLEELADRLTERRRTAASYRETVEEFESQRRTVRETRRKRQDLETEIEDLEATLADREESLETVEDQLESKVDRLSDLEAEVEAADEELTDLESEIKYTEAELEDAREELEAIERQAERRDLLEEELASLSDEIETLRTRKDQVKASTREAFDEVLTALVDRLEPGFESARLTSNFELVVAREGRETGLDALSEGEVELLGIVTALAGYEAYDVGEGVPIILLDSVGDLAGENLGPLVRYLVDRTTYLVTTAYPEQAVEADHGIDPSDWTVVSGDSVGRAPS